MSHSPEFVSLGGRFALPAGLRCVRCDHPLTYLDEVLRCKRCDTVYKLLERYPLSGRCPQCEGPAAWMGGVLVCSPVRNLSYCSRAFVPAAPAPLRPCSRCSRELPWSNKASLCTPCALRAYLELRPGAARIAAFDSPTTADWQEIVGFAETDSMWSMVGSAGRPGYDVEYYAVGVNSSVYRAEQLSVGFQPGAPADAPIGTAWLVRIHCPSGMTYEVAFPAGWVGDETAAVDDETAAVDNRRRRAAPLPERIVNCTGVAAGKVERELRTARAIVNALPRNPGGRPPDPVDDILRTIWSIRATGVTPTRTRVAQQLYSYANDPRDSLDQRLDRLEARTGITWQQLLAMEPSEF